MTYDLDRAPRVAAGATDVTAELSNGQWTEHHNLIRIIESTGLTRRTAENLIDHLLHTYVLQQTREFHRTNRKYRLVQ